MLNVNNFQKKLTRCDGFSIMETLIALSIFTIGILAVATLVLSSIGENASARRITEATALAEDRLEQLMAQSYDAISGGTAIEGAYEVVWDVAEDVIVAQTKSITVTVSWQYRGKQRNVTIRHLFSPLA
jgi:type IV pilus assembly protein PilV